MKVYGVYDSSNIDWCGYDDKKAECTVHFKSGWTYVYTGVDSTSFMNFYVSNSKGSAVHTILGKYSFTKFSD